MAFNDILSLLADEKFSQIMRQLADRRTTKIGFNAFELVSDSYRRENFHSDVIRAILDPAAHGEGCTFLKCFIKFLHDVACSQRNEKVATALSKMRVGLNTHVAREEGRIDVLVETDEDAIIIENKINGADDMERQLPRYFDKVVVEHKKNIVAIVYLTASDPKSPNQYGWIEDDARKVLPFLIPVVGFSESVPYNLVQGWIEPCELVAKGFSTKSVLSQYAELLRNQAGETMNNEQLLEMLNLMSQHGVNLMGLKEVIDSVPHAMASLIVSTCSTKPGLKKKPWVWSNSVAVFDLDAIAIPSHRKKFSFAVDVHCEDIGGYGISFFSRDDLIMPIARFLPLLKKFVDKDFLGQFKFDSDVFDSRLVLQLNEIQVHANIAAFISLVSRLVDFLNESRDEIVTIIKKELS